VTRIGNHFADGKRMGDGNMDNEKANQDSTLVSALRILARDIDSGDGVANAVIAEAADRIEAMGKEIKQIHRDYGCEVRDPCGTIWQHAAKVELERDKYRSAFDRLRDLLLEVLENDEVLEGFNADNLEPEFRQRIRDGLSWKIE
jgi:predicted trehalose synthase